MHARLRQEADGDSYEFIDLHLVDTNTSNPRLPAVPQPCTLMKRGCNAFLIWQVDTNQRYSQFQWRVT